ALHRAARLAAPRAEHRGRARRGTARGGAAARCPRAARTRALPLPGRRRAAAGRTAEPRPAALAASVTVDPAWGAGVSEPARTAAPLHRRPAHAVQSARTSDDRGVKV